MSETFRNPYIGHPSQLFRVNNYRVDDGFARDLRATDLRNGPLELTVAADKGMDFPYLVWKGINLGFVSPAGLVSPAFYDDKELGFLRAFFAGFLTTCGLTNTGSPCVSDGQVYGLHGRLNNIPAEGYSARLVQSEGFEGAEAEGLMRQGVLFGEKLTLRRRITCRLGEKGFTFTDTVTNHGYLPQQHMILYHFNMGYPLLSEDTEILIPAAEVAPRNEDAARGMNDRLRYGAPVPGTPEQCFFYQMKKDENGTSFAGVYNHKLGVGLTIGFDTKVLDHFTQWKHYAAGEYVLGLEPGNATPLGVEEEKKLGHVKTLAPGEVREYRFRIRILEGEDDLAAVRREAEALR